MYVALSAVHVMFGFKQLPCLEERLQSGAGFLSHFSGQQKRVGNGSAQRWCMRSYQRCTSHRGLVLLEVSLVTVIALLICLDLEMNQPRESSSEDFRPLYLLFFLNGVC